MKIGIVTVYDSSNCGSFLQAYAMKSFLEQDGHQVYFANFRSDKELKKIYYDNGLLVRSIIKYPLIGIERYLFAREKYKIYTQQIRYSYDVISLDKLIEMDLVILGSDEIWNINSKIFRNPIFYGEKMNNVLAYAISIGSSKLEDWNKYPELIHLIKKIPYIMVRDEKTFSFVKSVSLCCPEYSCDPTLLVNKKIYEKQKQLHRVEEKYLLIYAYQIDSWLKKCIKRYAKENKLKIVSAGFFHIWAEKNINCTPLEIYSLMKNATCVITTTFHGSMFSILTHSRFLVYPGGSIDKVTDLLIRFAADSRLITTEINYQQFLEQFESEFDYSKTDDLIEKFRKDSILRLRNCMTNMIKRRKNDRTC